MVYKWNKGELKLCISMFVLLIAFLAWRLHEHKKGKTFFSNIGLEPFQKKRDFKKNQKIRYKKFLILDF